MKRFKMLFLTFLVVLSSLTFNIDEEVYGAEDEGTITIIKELEESSDHEFTMLITDINGNPVIIGGQPAVVNVQAGKSNSIDLPYGSYKIQETNIPSKYKFGGISVVAANDPLEQHVDNYYISDTIILGPDYSDLTATVVNNVKPRGTITIEKEIEGREEDSTEFIVRVADGENYTENFTVSMNNSATTPELDLGTYTITELITSGYSFVKIVVNGVEYPNGAEIELTEEVNHITVKVVNREIPKGTITIEKEVEGREEDSTEFIVRVAGGENYTEDFTVSMNNSATTPELDLGTYTITELITSGYSFVKIVVNGVEYPNGAEIELTEEVNHMTVKVVNREIPKGTITIEKEVEGREEDSTEFIVRVAGGENYTEDFTVSMNNSATTPELSLGTYTITELTASGYSFVKIIVNGVEYSNGAEIELTEEVNNVMVNVVNSLKPIPPPPPSNRKSRIKLEKKVSPTTAKVGDEVEYTLIVKNTGDYTLSDVTITDPILGKLDEFKLGKLGEGDSITVKVSYKIPEGASGLLENTATVTGERGYKTVSDKDSAVLKIIETNPTIDIVKSVNKTAVEPGETVEYTFIVTNTGDIELEKVVVTDPLFGNEWKYEIGNLKVEEQSTFTQSYIVPEGVLGQLKNTAIVTGKRGSKTVSDEDSAVLEIIEVNPAIEIVKSVNKTLVDPGEMVEYTFIVTNTGDVDLEKVVVTDLLLGEEWNNEIGNLKAGEESTFTQSYTIPEDASGKLENVAIVTGSHGDKTVSAIGNVDIEILVSLATPEVPKDLPHTGGPVEPEIAFAGIGGLLILVGKMLKDKKNK